MNPTKKYSKLKLLLILLLVILLAGVSVFHFFFLDIGEDTPPSLSMGTAGLQGFIGTGTYIEFEDSDLGGTGVERDSGVQYYYLYQTMSYEEIIESIIPIDTSLKCLIASYNADDEAFYTFPEGPYEGTNEVNEDDIDIFNLKKGEGFVLVCSDEYETNDIFAGDEEPSDLAYDFSNRDAGWHLTAIANDSDLSTLASSCSNRVESVWVQYDDNDFAKTDKDNPILEDGYYMVWFKLNGNEEPCIGLDETMDEFLENEESLSLLEMLVDTPMERLVDGIAKIPTISNELQLETVVKRKENVSVNLPKQYEAMADKYLQDMIYCMDLAPRFIGVEPKYDEIQLKYYVSDDNSNLGFHAGSGTIAYKRSQNNADHDYNDIIENVPDTFLYKSGPEYCANAHEFVHYVVDGLHLQSWANEGIAEYTQKHIQNGSKDSLICQENGWFGMDYWDTGQEKFFPFSDLSKSKVADPLSIQSGSKWYRTAMCQWEMFDEKFGKSTRYAVFHKLVEDEVTDLRDLHGTYYLIHVMLDTVDHDKQDELKDHLGKFGFIEGVDY